MASVKHESSAKSPAMLSSTFDISQFINLDQASSLSPTIPPSQPGKGFSISSPTPVRKQDTTLQQTPQQQFSRPSHQYDAYKQQTGLPVGAIANTFALNETDPYFFPSSQGIDSPADGYFGFSNGEVDFVNFNTFPIQTVSGGDVEMDYNNPLLNNPNYMSPATVTSDGTTPTPPQSMHPGRVWPGMHQQAALAKAQQQAQQQAALAAQRQRSVSAQPRRQDDQDDRDNEDVVEESISRLLSRMRNGSIASSAGDEAGASGSNAHGRSRKDEEDMDEDERLLASEEGKKLSSKERRQLRNKVSARAFRSRRKEYIGQLEGEIASKMSESDELRVKNQELMAENKRLSDLTRMLLSSPSFSGFLNELGASGTNPSAFQDLAQPQRPQQPQQQQQQQRSHAPKDPDPNQFGTHGNRNMHLGMTMIPEETNLEIESNTHAQFETGNTGFGRYDAQVYALRTLSPAPPLDTPDFTLLNDKISSSSTPTNSDESWSKTSPTEIQPLPEFISAPTTDMLPSTPSTQAADEEDDGEEDTTPPLSPSDPCYELYADCSPAPSDLPVEAPLPSKLEQDVTSDDMLQFAKRCRDLEVLGAQIRNSMGRQ